MTHDELRRFRDGTLSADQVLYVGRHLRTCVDCRRKAEELYPAKEGEERLREAVAAEARPERRPMAARAPYWLAASIVVAALGVGGWWVLMPEPVGPPVVVHPPAPIPKALVPSTGEPFDYGREDWNALVRGAVKAGGLSMPEELRALRRRPDILRDVADRTARTQLSPVQTVIESQRPRFSWTAVAGAAGYRVFVYAGNAEVVRSRLLRAARWQPEQLLRRGLTYEWQVIATMRDGREKAIPSPPDPPALFTVLSDAAAEEIAEAARRFPNDHLLRGALYARYGVTERAREELRLSNDAAAPAIAQSVAAWEDHATSP